MARKRTSTTRFDNRGRKIVFAVIGVVTMLASSLVGLLISEQQQGERRNDDIIPRNLDVWSIYPDDSVRFSTLFYPTPLDSDEESSVIYDAAGPLFTAETDIISGEVINGDLISREVFSGGAYISGEGAPEVLYEVFRLAVPPGNDYYGLDVKAINSPYVNLDPFSQIDITRLATFGAEPQERFGQVIVAIAFPADTTIQEITQAQPYREREIGGWIVYYFDTTNPDPGTTIQFRYVPIADPPPADLNIRAVERQR